MEKRNILENSCVSSLVKYSATLIQTTLADYSWVKEQGKLTTGSSSLCHSHRGNSVQYTITQHFKEAITSQNKQASIKALKPEATHC